MSTAAKMHAERLKFITSEPVREAYRYLIEYASRLPKYHCYPDMNGVIQSFRYADSKSQPRSQHQFSFITNKKWLLFYFRRPDDGDRQIDILRLKHVFPEANKTPKGELTVRVKHVADARRLMAFVFENDGQPDVSEDKTDRIHGRTSNDPPATDLTVSNWRIIQLLYDGFVELAGNQLRNIKLPFEHFRALALVARTKPFGRRVRNADDNLLKAVGNWLYTQEFGAWRNTNSARPYGPKNKELWQNFDDEITRLRRDKITLSEAVGRAQQRSDHLPDEVADPDDSSEFVPQDGDERKRIVRQICERRGQQDFRNDLRKRYGDRCLVTGCKVLAVLEAAHIKPYQGEKDNHSENGLLLRADIHTLFDLDLLGIEPQSLRVELHPSLADSAAYKNLAGKTLRCSEKQRPSKVALKLRYQQFQERLEW